MSDLVIITAPNQESDSTVVRGANALFREGEVQERSQNEFPVEHLVNYYRPGVSCMLDLVTRLVAVSP